MKPALLAFATGLLALISTAQAADFLEIKGERDADNIRLPFNSGRVYHAALQALPHADALTSPPAKTPTPATGSGYYVGLSLQANLTPKGIQGSVIGNLLEGYIDFSPRPDVQQLSPILTNHEKKFSLKKPSPRWTTVKIDKTTSYQIRWITD